MLALWPDRHRSVKDVQRQAVSKVKAERPRHVLKWNPSAGKWVCGQCYRSFRSKISKQALGSCAGKPWLVQAHGGQQFVQRMHRLGHRVWTACIDDCDKGSIIFCTKCGAYSESRVKTMFRDCPGHRVAGGPKARLQRMLEGKHPTKRVARTKPLRIGA